MMSMDKTHSNEYRALNRVSLPNMTFLRIDMPERVCVRHEIVASDDFSEKKLLISENKVLTLYNGMDVNCKFMMVHKFTNNLRITPDLMPFFRAIKSA